MVKSRKKNTADKCTLPLSQTPYKQCCLRLLEQPAEMQAAMEEEGAKAVIDRIRGCFPEAVIDLRTIDLRTVDLAGVWLDDSHTMVAAGIFHAKNRHLATFDGVSLVKLGLVAAPA